MTGIISAAASLDDLTAQIKIKLVENHVLTNTLNKNINQNSIEIGQWLTQAKKLVKHGQWQIWLKDNFNLSADSAQNYMKVAAYFGVNSTFKNRDVSVFPFSNLVALTKLKPDELQNFLADQEHNGFDLAKLSVRNLSKTIKQWKNPLPEFQPTTIDIDAEIKTAPAYASPLKLPPPSFHIIPASLQAAADEVRVEISINFIRALQLPNSDIFISPLNLSTLQKYSSIATSVIFTKMEFVRSDGAIKKRQCCIWYFGGDSGTFAEYFSQFGEVINLHTQKSPLILAGNISNNIILS